MEWREGVMRFSSSDPRTLRDTRKPDPNPSVTAIFQFHRWPPIQFEISHECGSTEVFIRKCWIWWWCANVSWMCVCVCI